MNLWHVINKHLTTQKLVLFRCLGHLEEYQNPDVTDAADETAAWKAARNNDVQKLEYLALANADLDHRSFSNAGGRGVTWK